MTDFTPTFLTEEDRQLLLTLDFHARDNSEVLAKKLGTSATRVDERIKTLIQRGVIKGFHPVINMYHLGYYCGRLLITLQRYSRDDKEDIIDYLINHQAVFWLLDIQGEYDLLIDLWSRSVKEFNSFTKELEDHFGHFIKRKNEAIITDFIYFQARYLTKTTPTEEIRVGESPKKYELSPTEERVLKLLSINARFSDSEIAMNSHIQQDEAASIIKRLEKRHIIEGYRPLIDNLQIGYTWYKIWLNVHKGKQKTYQELLEYIKNQPMTVWLVDGVGLLGDIEIEVMVESTAELFDFINQMRLQFPAVVEEYRTLLFAEVLKELYLPFY